MRKLLLLVLLIVLTGPAYSSDWMGFRNDISKTGRTDDTIITPFTSMWRFTPGGAIRTAPAVYNSTVYFGSASQDNYLYAVDITSGKRKWSFPCDKAINSSPEINNGLLYFGSDDGKLYCLNADTGAFKWSYPANAPVTSSPAVYNGIVYFGSQDNNVYAVDASTGQKKWSYTCGKGVNSSPAASNGFVYIGSDDGKLYCLTADTGTFKWSYPANAPVTSLPAVSNGMVYFGSQDNNVYAVDASTGQKKWSYTCGNSVNSSPAASNGFVYIGSDDGKLYCLTADTGTFKWSYTVNAPITTPPIVSDGRVYFGAQDNNIYSLDSTTGEKEWFNSYGKTGNSSITVSNGMIFIGTDDGTLSCLEIIKDAADPPERAEGNWAFITEASIISSPAVYQGRVYFGCENGNLYAVDAQTGERKWSFPTGGRIDSSPTIDSGLLYVGSDDGNIYCLYADTGNLKWSYSTGYVIRSSPVVSEGRILCGDGDYSGYPNGRQIVCLDSQTGVFLWSYSALQPCCSSAASANGDFYFGDGGGKYVRLDKWMGAIDWIFPSGLDALGNPYISAPAIKDNKIILASGFESWSIFALDINNGQPIWEYKVKKNPWWPFSIVSSPAVGDDYVVIVAGYPPALTCLDLNTGVERWERSDIAQNSDSSFVSSPAICGNLVVCGQDNGNIYAIDAATGNIMGSYKLNGSVKSSVAVSNWWLYAASIEGSITSPIGVMNGFTNTSFQYISRGGWNLISLPFAPLQSDPQNTISSTSSVVLNKYDGTNGYRVFPPSMQFGNLEAGRGYWVDLSPDGAVVFPGTRITGDAVVHLVKGWNITGTPLYQNYKWSDIKVKVDNTVMGIMDAASPVSTTIFSWDGPGYKYVSNSGDQLVLTPYAGFWVYTSTDCDLLYTQTN